MLIQRILPKCFLLFLLFLLKQPLSAQIVNIEDKRLALTDTAGWFGTVDVAFNLVKNAKMVTTMKGGARLDFLHDRHSAFSLTNYSFVKAGTEQFVNQGFQHFRYNYEFNPRLTGEIFTQAQYNEQIRIKLRALLGTGIRVELSQKEKQKAFAGLSYMYEYESIKDTSIFNRNHRLSSYLSFNITPHPQFSISNTSYYQPLVNDFTDFRLTTSTSLQIQVTERLFLKSSFSLTYDSQITEEVSNVPATIYSFLNGLGWSF